jgi:hypothetical protein
MSPYDPKPTYGRRSAANRPQTRRTLIYRIIVLPASSPFGGTGDESGAELRRLRVGDDITSQEFGNLLAGQGPA